MPPPSLSATAPIEQEHLIAETKKSPSDLRPVLYPIKQPPIQVIPITDNDNLPQEDEDEEEDDEEEEDEDEDEEDEDEDRTLSHKRSIPSFSKSHEPSTSTTKSCVFTSPPSSSAPDIEEPKNRWMETIAQLRRSLTRSIASSTSTNTNTKNFIPMPLPPKRTLRKKRRSEATTQPRFNPDTNTYTRDTRSNPDHLRMISAELNMMRHKKLSSPLKPRGFLPRRTDAFVRGEQRKLSSLSHEIDSYS
jgi:hypothetical protein